MRKCFCSFIVLIALGTIHPGDLFSQKKKDKTVELSGDWKTTPSGLKYMVVSKGTGTKIEDGDIVTCNYIEKTEKDSVIDDSRLLNTPFVVKVSTGSAIPGFLEALKLSNVGDKLEIFVPYSIGYGEVQAGSINPKTNLKFTIEIISSTQGLRPFDTKGKDTVKLSSGLKYIMVLKGNGMRPGKGDIVQIRYTGYLPDGKVFDSSVERNETIKFNLGASLPGLDEGIGQMEVGGKARIIIPYMLAFGEAGRGPIPAKTDIIYDVELVDAQTRIVPVPYDVKGKDTVTVSNGLKYIIVQSGSGAASQVGKKVKVHYTGYFLDGNIFDSSVERDAVFEFVLGVNPVISGWLEALKMMKVGDKWRLIIPPGLAYGPNGMPPKIPGNTTLVFDVELVGVGD